MVWGWVEKWRSILSQCQPYVHEYFLSEFRPHPVTETQSQTAYRHMQLLRTRYNTPKSRVAVASQGGPPQVTPSRVRNPNEIKKYVAKFRKNSGQTRSDG